jgi:hypothetical protein
VVAGEARHPLWSRCLHRGWLPPTTKARLLMHKEPRRLQQLRAGERVNKPGEVLVESPPEAVRPAAGNGEVEQISGCVLSSPCPPGWPGFYGGARPNPYLGKARA